MLSTVHQEDTRRASASSSFRFQRAQAVLKDEGITLPVKATGYLLFRQANLDGELEARLVTWLGGDYSLDTVITNLRRLERVHADGGKRTFLVEEEEPGEMSYDPVGPEVFLGEPAEEDESEEENWVYMEEGQLDQVLEEDDVLDALATYQQVRSRSWEGSFSSQATADPGRGKESVVARTAPAASAVPKATARAERARADAST